MIRDGQGNATLNTMGSHWHGTHVAGTIAATQNNGIGIAGVATNVKIMAIRTVPDDADELDSHIVEAYLYAAKNGARLINCSFGKELNEGGMSNQINQDVGDVPGNRYNADLSFTYYKDREYELERKFDFAALVNDQSLTMWSLQEAYVAKNGVFRSYDRVDKTGDVVKIGRQNLAWSNIDQSWGLGKINNRKNFDGFMPGQEGLVGIAYENKSANGVWKHLHTESFTGIWLGTMGQ